MSDTPIYEPAFPVVSEIMGHSSGMSLRDYFAAKAMPEAYRRVESGGFLRVAQLAYEMADAMLAERSKE